MKKLLPVLVFLLILQPPLAAQQEKILKCGQIIYVEPMPNGFDGYLRAALVKRHFALSVTTDKAKATLFMSGESTDIPDHWYNSGTANTVTGNVTVSDASGKVLWAGSAGDRNIWWGNIAKHGPEKAAERIIGKFSGIAPQRCESTD